MKAIYNITSGLSVFLFTICYNANAQKLPGVQEKSIYAPADIKVDGKTTEWDNKFEAYNNATGLFYTLSNDESNLYVTLQATNIQTVEKILAGGITFIIKNSDKKTGVAPVSITYPLIDKADNHDIETKLIELGDAKYDRSSINNLFTTAAKEISVKGIKDVTDTLLSVYNDSGIKATALFDDQKSFTYELKVPTKYFKKSQDSSMVFNYNVILNGMKVPKNLTLVAGHNLAGPDKPNAEGDLLDMTSVTDFSGTYTLAKK